MRSIMQKGRRRRSGHNLPLENRFFTGRTAYLEKLRELLEKHHVVALSGLGGIEKTEIALQYAHQHHSDMYPTTLWVNAADTTTLRSSFASLAETLRLPEKDERKPEPRIKAVREWLKEHTDWLLIMDNADELPDVEPFVLSKPHGHIILTTRWHPSVKFAKLLPLEVMDTEEGRRFLLGRTDRSPKGEELDAAGQLAEVLGGHALALEQAGAYIAETDTSFADYLKLYEKNRFSLLSQYGAFKDEHNKHRLTVTATFKGSLARAQELSSLAEDILHFCAFLQPDAIPEELFQHDESFTHGTVEFDKAIAALLRYSLIKRNTQEKTLSMHRLVQAVLVDSMDANFRLHWKECVGQRLNAYFPRSDFRSGNWTFFDRYLSNVITHASWTEDDPTPAIEVGELYFKAGSYVLSRWWYSVAEDLLPRAHASFAQHFGDWHPRTMQVLATLAILWW